MKTNTFPSLHDFHLSNALEIVIQNLNGEMHHQRNLPANWGKKKEDDE